MATNIYLSVNNTYQNVKYSGNSYANNDNFIIIPIIPAEVTVNKPQNLQEFETVSLKKLAFIAPADLKEISWSSFFPCRDYSYVKGERLKALQYVYIIDKWIEQKLPIRLIITGLDDDNPESIYMSSSITDFKYKFGSDGDLYYDISFKEYPLTGSNEEGEELLSKEYDDLLAKIEDNKNNIEALMTGYKTIDDIPDYGKAVVQELIDKGYIISEGEYVADEETGEPILKATGNLNITEQLLKGLVIGYRAGAFHTGMIYSYNDGNIPDYARDLLSWLLVKGYIKGDSVNPEVSKFELTNDMLKMFVTLARSGALGEEARQIQENTDRLSGGLEN